MQLTGLQVVCGLKPKTIVLEIYKYRCILCHSLGANEVGKNAIALTLIAQRMKEDKFNWILFG